MISTSPNSCLFLLVVKIIYAKKFDSQGSIHQCWVPDWRCYKINNPLLFMPRSTGSQDMLLEC